jgi:hypothetical protein
MRIKYGILTIYFFPEADRDATPEGTGSPILTCIFPASADFSGLFGAPRSLQKAFWLREQRN